MHLDEVHVGIDVDPFLGLETEAGPSGERQLPLPRPTRSMLDPLDVPPPAELIRPPDGQLEVDGCRAPAQLFDAARVRTRLTGQVQLLIFVHQPSWDAQLTGFDPFDLLAVPADET